METPHPQKEPATCIFKVLMATPLPQPTVAWLHFGWSAIYGRLEHPKVKWLQFMTSFVKNRWFLPPPQKKPRWFLARFWLLCLLHNHRKKICNIRQDCVMTYIMTGRIYSRNSGLDYSCQLRTIYSPKSPMGGSRHCFCLNGGSGILPRPSHVSLLLSWNR